MSSARKARASFWRCVRTPNTSPCAMRVIASEKAMTYSAMRRCASSSAARAPSGHARGVSTNAHEKGTTMSAGTRLASAPQPMHMWTGPSGIALAADTWGDPDGPLVILLHGGGQTRHAWGETGARLGEAGYFAVAYDARGHGDSGWSPDGDYSLDALAQDLQCVISAVNGARPVLVGASLGGATSLVAMGERLVDASALILVDI